MKPRKAAALAAEAVRSGELVVIVFLNGKTMQGRVTDVATQCEPMGPVGGQVAGPLSVHLTIEMAR